MSMRQRTKHNVRLTLTGAVPVAGFCACWLLPLGMTFYYAFVDSAFDLRFAGLDNFAYILDNRYFQLGMVNLLLLGSGMILAALGTAIVTAPLLCEHSGLARTGTAILLLPLLIPSVSAVKLWQEVFDVASFLAPASSRAAIVTLFLWKYAGVGAVLLCTALRKIPQSILDAASLDGAGPLRTYLCIRLPIAGNQLAGVLIVLIMFMFRAYKESYLLFGLYPSEKVYMLQHYMNNQYLKMNLQYVAATAVVLILLALLLYGAGFLLLRGRRRMV